MGAGFPRAKRCSGCGCENVIQLFVYGYAGRPGDLDREKQERGFVHNGPLSVRCQTPSSIHFADGIQENANWRWFVGVRARQDANLIAA
jgi:hypothetical protein